MDIQKYSSYVLKKLASPVDSGQFDIIICN